MHQVSPRPTDTAALQYWSHASLHYGAAIVDGIGRAKLRLCDAQLRSNIPIQESHQQALDCYLSCAQTWLRGGYTDGMHAVANAQAGWLYESSPYVRNLTLAKHQYEKASDRPYISIHLLVLWMRIRLQMRAFADAIRYRDWTRAFL